MDDGSDDKKSKGIKKCSIIKITKFYDYKNCLFKNQNHTKITTNI